MDRREAALVGVGRENLALVLHHGGKRERLATRAGAEIDHLFARLRAAQRRGELRALILNLDLALQEGGLRMDRRALGVGTDLDAQAPWRPPGGLRRIFGKLLG